MAISLNPGDIFKIFFERHDKNLAKTVAYMEAVVAAAKHLADVWHRTYQHLAEKGSVNLISDGVMGWNISPYRQLEEFYRVTSSVLWKHPDVNSAFLDGLARLMIQRTITKRAYEEIVKRSAGAFFLDANNPGTNLDNMKNGVEALEREVAALEVVLAHFKAVGK